MRKPTALRILQLLSLLPAGLAALVCYDIASPMHPEILTPVEDCWCFTTQSRYNSHSKDKGGVANIGGGPPPAPGLALAPAPAPGFPAPAPAGAPASARPGPAPAPVLGPAPKSPAPAPAAGPDNQNKDNGHNDDGDGDGPTQSMPKSAAQSTPAGPAPASATTSSYNSDDVNLPFFSFAPESPLKSILAAPALPPPSWNSDNKVYFNIDCRETKDVCDGMAETLNAAGWYISQVFSSLESQLTSDNQL